VSVKGSMRKLASPSEGARTQPDICLSVALPLSVLVYLTQGEVPTLIREGEGNGSSSYPGHWSTPLLF